MNSSTVRFGEEAVSCIDVLALAVSQLIGLR